MAYRRNSGRRGIRRGRGFRRSRGLWLPTLGTQWLEGESVYYDASFTFNTQPVEDDKSLGPVQEYRALVPDFTFPNNTANIAASLHDRTQGNEWKLDRIVGGCHVHAKESDIAAGAWDYIQVSAGIFVARAEDDDNSAPDLYQDEYDPLNRQNIQNSWAWRKTWILANPSGTAVLRDDFPLSNINYSSPMMSAEVNVKAKRRIRREQRLWFTISAIGWEGTQVVKNQGIAGPFAEGVLDIRIFGKMIQNPTGASTF